MDLTVDALPSLGPGRRHRAMSTWCWSAALACGLVGCASLSNRRVERLEDLNADLRQQLDGSKDRVAQNERDALRASREIDRLKEQLAARAEIESILNQRVENLMAQTRRLNADVTGIVMTASGIAPASSVPTPLTNVSQSSFELSDALVEKLSAIGKSFAGVVFDPAERVCRFESRLLFIDGGDRIRPEGKAALRELARILNEGKARSFNTLIVGHTDGTGVVPPNLLAQHPTDWHLAAHQAIEVQQQLEEEGLSPIRVGIVSYAGHQPLRDGNDPQSRALNARIEVFLLPPDPP